VCVVRQSLVLVLLDLEALMPILQGVVMELNDCSLPLLKGVIRVVCILSLYLFFSNYVNVFSYLRRFCFRLLHFFLLYCSVYTN